MSCGAAQPTEYPKTMQPLKGGVSGQGVEGRLLLPGMLGDCWEGKAGSWEICARCRGHIQSHLAARG